MKKNTKIGVTFIVLSIIVIIIGVFFAVLVNKEKTIQESIVIIKNAYTKFSADVVDNYQIRTDLIAKIDTFNNETYAEEHETFVELLNAYNEKIKSLNTNVAILEEKCATDYEDTQTTIFCSYYQELYESVNNIYIENVTGYNDKITSYNETNEEDYEQFTMINKDYVDFNKDGKYEGKMTE